MGQDLGERESVLLQRIAQLEQERDALLDELLKAVGQRRGEAPKPQHVRAVLPPARLRT
jgi:hypothetical protein